MRTEDDGEQDVDEEVLQISQSSAVINQSLVWLSPVPDLARGRPVRVPVSPREQSIPGSCTHRKRSSEDSEDDLEYCEDLGVLERVTDSQPVSEDEGDGGENERSILLAAPLGRV